MTIDDLARQARLPVRTIREYHTMRLLPPTQRRGRVGYYGDEHVQRLELIARLQRRGYSLAGIRDLLRAWDGGGDLPSLLGVEPGQAALDETPLRLTRAELLARVPGLSGSALDRALEVGLLQRSVGHHGETDFLVRSPALVAFVADGAAAGIALDEMLDLADVLRRELTTLADTIADMFTDRLLPLLRAGRSPADLTPLLQRGRLLLLQGTASTLADRLGAAMLRSADAAAPGAPAEAESLRTVINQVRIGVVTDAAGNIAAATP
jgi:DNA-binding transcriptional MerR regulator